MIYNDIDFRTVYHKLVVLPSYSLRNEVRDFPGNDRCNRLLTYAYVDHEKGLMLEVLACGVVKEKSSYSFFQTNDEVSVKLKAEDLKDIDEIETVDGDISNYQKKIDSLHIYEENEEINDTRDMAFLDPLRDPFYPDEVQVILRKKSLQEELCVLRIEGIGDHCFIGKLMSEPRQDFGYHTDDTIAFYAGTKEDGTVFCFSDLDPDRELSKEDLKGGVLLKETIQKALDNWNQENLFEVLELLRDSDVWIPCRAVFSEMDQKRIEELIGDPDKTDFSELIGKEFSAKDHIRMIPDILQNDTGYYFPVFTSADEMGEYGNSFSKVEHSFMHSITLAENNEKEVKGIVINAFTQNFVLPRELFEVVKKLKSRVKNL